MLLLTLPMKIFGITGTIVLLVVLYWLFIGTGMKLNRCENITAFMAQSAKNPISGKVKNFATPCEVPFGWKMVNPN